MKQNLQLKQQLSLKTFQINSLNLLIPTTTELEKLIDQQLNENYCLISKNPKKQISQEYIDFAQSSIEESKSLHQHLQEQIRLNCQKKLLDKTLNLLNYLNKNGLFKISKKLLQQELHLTQEALNNLLKILQDCTPVGVGAFSITECFILQLQKIKTPESLLAQTLLTEYKDFNNLSQINKSTNLKASEQEILNAINLIKRLSPTPHYTNETSVIITPEIIITQENNTLVITQTRQIPELLLNPHYLKLQKDMTLHPEELKQIKEKINNAKEFITNLKRRFSSLKTISQFISDYQHEFFHNEFDATKLRPLTIKRIAQEMQVHSSTISRAIKNKYLQLPNQQTLPFKYFISVGVGKKSSRQAIKKIIANIISQEDMKSPLSDQAITEILNKTAIKVSRRVVAKYRHELSILNSQQRKTL